MAKKKKSAFYNKIPRSLPVGWTRDWRKEDEFSRSQTIEIGFDALTVEDRFYLHFVNDECMDSVSGKYLSAIANEDNPFPELKDPKWQERFLRAWLEYKDTKGHCGTYIQILVKRLVLKGYISISLVKRVLPVSEVMFFLVAALTAPEGIADEDPDKWWACLDKVSIGFIERILDVKQISESGREYLLHKQAVLQHSTLDTRHAEILGVKEDPRYSGAL